VRTPVLAALAAFLCSVVPAAASAPRADAPADAHALIERMVASEPGLLSYRARVHVNVHMLSFPYLSPQLDGTSYYKRPASYEVVFDSVPFYMKGFSRLFADMGQPQAWERDQDVALMGTRVVNGQALLVLRMTKKIHSDVLDHTDAFVDPRTYELLRMVWHYRSGGTIVMTQTYRNDRGFIVPAQQHASIDIPHVRAVGDAVYDGYQINVVVDDGVFTK
jgi:hypothetical protein